MRDAPLPVADVRLFGFGFVSCGWGSLPIPDQRFEYPMHAPALGRFLHSRSSRRSRWEGVSSVGLFWLEIFGGFEDFVFCDMGDLLGVA